MSHPATVGHRNTRAGLMNPVFVSSVLKCLRGGQCKCKVTVDELE